MTVRRISRGEALEHLDAVGELIDKKIGDGLSIGDGIDLLLLDAGVDLQTMDLVHWIRPKAEAYGRDYGRRSQGQDGTASTFGVGWSEGVAYGLQLATAIRGEQRP